MVWVGRNLQRSCSPTPLQWTGTPIARSGDQCPIQPDSECLQRWSFYHLWGKPIPVPHHSYCKQLFPSTQSKSPLFPGWTAPALSSCPCRRNVPSLGELLWPSSECTPVEICLSCTEDSTFRCSTPGEVSTAQSRRKIQKYPQEVKPYSFVSLFYQLTF